MRAKICFAALAVVQDSNTNTISAFNIFEGVAAVGLPFLMQNVSFFVLWERDPGDPPRVPGTFTVTIGDLELTRHAVNVDFGAVLRHRSVVNLNGLVVPRAGELRFSIALENGLQAEYEVDVAAAPPGVQVQPQAH
jgi:hypothetical protein